MPDAPIAERVREAYLRPIRSVLVVDDDFPSYDAEAPGRDPDRARSLWRACRKAGYLCDIDDGAALVKGQNPPHLTKSDLVILDYHLEGENPTCALRLLCQLAPSEHASIVVVYTKDQDLIRVRTAIASHLRGSLEAGQLCGSPEAQAEWDRVETKIVHRPTPAQFDAFLSGDTKQCWTGNALLEELTDLGVPPPQRIKIATAHYERLLRDEVARSGVARTDAPMQMGGGKGGVPPWVYMSNLFVACVRKTEDNLRYGSQVFAALETALCNWQPDFMVSAVAYARAEFARGGFQLERVALNDQKLKSGWLYHAWSGSPDEQATRIRSLFERLISTYAKRVLDKMIQFGTAHVPPSETPDDPAQTLKSAIRHFFGGQRDLENGVIHALNEFLVIEEVPKFVETGTIFARVADGSEPKEVLVCVTPACDLVPRLPRKHTWESTLHPARATIAIRAKVFDATKHLLRAEESKAVFLTIAGKPKAIELVGEAPPVPSLEWLFLEDMGRIAGGKVSAMQVGYQTVTLTAPAGEPAAASAAEALPDSAASKSLTLITSEMRVLGQIRAIYASRILQYAGQHLARIGVDFVNFPAPPATEGGRKK